MLKTRIITALVLLACFIPALFFLDDTLWAGFILMVSLLALYEWGVMIGLQQNQQRWYLIVTAIVAIGLIVWMHNNFHGFFYQSLKIFLMATLFWVIVVPFWIAKPMIKSNVWVNLFLGWLLIGPLWLAFICAKRVDPWLLLVIISTIWIADSAAYFAGKNYGKHKLAPQVSPGKTWEGVIGALIAVSVFGLLIWYFQGFDNLLIVPALCIIAILGVYGDLFESMFKRQANLKDSGQLLPGHGGILDRIDGVIPAMPIGLFLLYLYRYYQASLAGI